MNDDQNIRQPVIPAGSDDSTSHELARLGLLHQQGVLTDAEFQAAKARLLGMAGGVTSLAPPPSQHVSVVVGGMPPSKSNGVAKGLLWMLAIVILVVASVVIYQLGRDDAASGQSAATEAEPQTTPASIGVPACDSPQAVATLMRMMRKAAKESTEEQRRLIRALLNFPVDFPEAVANAKEIYSDPQGNVRACIADMKFPNEVNAIGYSIITDEVDGFEVKMMTPAEARSRFKGSQPVSVATPDSSPVTGYMTGTATMSAPGTVAAIAPSPATTPVAPVVAPITAVPVPSTAAPLPAPTSGPREVSGSALPIATKYDGTLWSACMEKAGIGSMGASECWVEEVDRVDALLSRAYTAALNRAQDLDTATGSPGSIVQLLKRDEARWWKARESKCEREAAAAENDGVGHPEFNAMSCSVEASYARAVKLWRFNGEFPL